MTVVTIGSGRRAVRRGVRRAADAAMQHYREAVGAQSPRLPAYLAAADAAELALRARRRGRTSAQWDRPSPIGPAVADAAISAAGELTFVLTGAATWRRTIAGVALVREGRLEALPDALIQSAAGVIRVNVTVPDRADAIVLLDEDGDPLELPTPDLAAPGVFQP